MKATASQILAVLLVVCGCTNDTAPLPESPDSSGAAKAPEADAGRLVFPESVATGDGTVNELVRAAMTACLDNDYDALRALWSATERPLKRRQFDRQWQPVRRITVREVQPMRYAEDDRLLYYVHAGFEFGVGARQPERDVVLLVVLQNEAWRLARAPKSLVRQVRDKNSDDAESHGK